MTIKILITCLFGLSLQVMAQQPIGTYNVKTDGTAMASVGESLWPVSRNYSPETLFYVVEYL